MKLFVAALVLCFGLGACGSPTGGGAGGGGEDDYSGAWKLTEGRSPDGPIEIVPGYDITLELGDDGNASGQSACNFYGVQYRIDGSSFDAGLAGGTDMGCDPKVMQAESRYLAAIAAVDQIARAGDLLTLDGGNAHLAFEFVPPPPTAELVDTTWHLESILEGKGSDGTASSAIPAELRLDSDGTLSGTTGCRKFTGRWSEAQGSISLSEFGMEADGRVGDCNSQEAAQDDLIGGVIGDGFTAEITEHTLTVYGLHGVTGLSYRAP